MEVPEEQGNADEDDDVEARGGRHGAEGTVDQGQQVAKARRMKLKTLRRVRAVSPGIVWVDGLEAREDDDAKNAGYARVWAPAGALVGSHVRQC